MHEAQRMNRLIGNLLDLTRLSEGGIELKRDGFAIDELVGAVLGRLHVSLAQHPVSLQFADNLPLVQGDEVMIEQVLANKHAPAGTAVAISAAPLGDWIEVVVRDHGPGFPVGEEERVFAKFHQARPEGAQSGFGLGLAICKAIVEAHGGTIVARNAPGGGAEFRFTLPTTKIGG
jgi:two-component system sensor histidine kinase KdpD